MYLYCNTLHTKNLLIGVYPPQIKNFMKTEITDEQLKNLCSQIEELTDNNNHTEAVKIVCGFLGYEDLHAILCEVENLHCIAGSLSLELSKIRRKCHETMLKNIYSDYCTSVYIAIKNAY